MMVMLYLRHAQDGSSNGDMAHCDVSIATQWAPGPLHPKGKIRVSLPNKGYLLLMFFQWV